MLGVGANKEIWIIEDADKQNPDNHSSDTGVLQQGVRFIPNDQRIEIVRKTAWEDLLSLW